MPSQKSIILNSTHIVSGTNNSKFRYNLVGNYVVKNTETKVGLASFSFYSSIFNITSAYGNNTITINWLGTNYVLVIEDGYYDVDAINYRIQAFCISNNLYVINSNGEFGYFVEASVNSNRYAVNVNLYAIPTSAQATTLGYSRPSGATWSFPVTSQTPTITFNNAFGLLIGYVGQTLPPTTQTTNQSYLSSLSPEINPVNSIVMTINLIHDKFSNPDNILYSCPITASIGSINSVQIGTIVYNSVSQNTYSYIEVQLLDQNFNAIALKDSEVVIHLSIIEPDK